MVPVFSADECDAMLGLMRSHAEPEFPAILNLDRRVPRLRGVMRDARVVSILESLQGGEVVGLMSQVLFKEVGTQYAGQAWNPHQDNSYNRSPYGTYITINIFLADADRNNGTLYIYPGSHTEGLLEARPVVSYREGIGENPGNMVDLPPFYRGREVDLNFKKGDMLILHGEVIHGSYPNLSATRSRPLFSISYMTRGVDFVPGRNANRTPISLHD